MSVPNPAGFASLRAVVRLAESTLPTEFGPFRLVVYQSDDPRAHPSLSNEQIALIKGEIAGKADVPVRLHSECLTSEVFSSLKCDCREQLIEAQRWIQTESCGCIIYLRQEGRGIGLANKIRAYALQELGADTVQANEQLHLPIDARDYAVAAEILRQLQVRSVRLMTNNPDKLASLTNHGVAVTGRIPLVIHPNPHSQRYLDVKRDRLHHLLPDYDEPSRETPTLRAAVGEPVSTKAC